MKRERETETERYRDRQTVRSKGALNLKFFFKNQNTIETNKKRRKKEEREEKKKQKRKGCQQHPVFPGGNPFKY